MKNHFLIPSLLIAFTIAFVSCSKEPTQFSNQFVEVVGESEIEMKPDEFFINIDVDNENLLKSEQLVNLEVRMVAALKELKLDPEKNLTIRSLGNTHAYWYWRKRNPSYSYKNYELKVSNPEIMDELMGKLQNLGIKQSYIARQACSKKKEFESKLRSEAVKNAKIKANELLSGVNQKAGSVLFIREVAGINQPMYDDSEYKGFYKTNESPQSVDANLSFTPDKITYQILARFEIKK